MALFRLLLPAFKVGVLTCLRHAQHRLELHRMLDGLEDALCLLTPEARLLHVNSALRRILAGEAEAYRLEEEVVRLAQSVGEIGRRRTKAQALPLPMPVTREVRTARGRYRLSATLLADEPGDREAVLVSVHRTAEPALTDADLEARGLTPREVQVARLLAAGRSNAEIARVLSVSEHTARRHTEHVLAKLGVHSRAAVAARLQGSGET